MSCVARKLAVTSPIAALLAAAFTLGGCTRLNPAFKDNVGSSADTSTSDSKTSSADTSGTSDLTSAESFDVTDTSGTFDTYDTTFDSTDTGVPECLLPWTNQLLFKIYDDLAPAGCSEGHAGSYVVRGLSQNNGMVVDKCNLTCTDCNSGALDEIEIFPVDLTGPAEALLGVCVHAEWEGLLDSTPDHCTYDKFRLAVVTAGELPVIIGSSGNGAVPIFAANDLGSLDPMIVVDEVCDCGQVGDACCDIVNPPTLYAFDVGNVDLIAVGDDAPVTVPAGTFDFFGVQAQEQDACGAKLEVSWLMVENDGTMP